MCERCYIGVKSMLKKKINVETMLKIVYQRRPKASTLNSRRHIVMCMVGAKIITQIDCETNHLKALLSSMHRLNTMSASDIVVITLNKH